MKAKKTKEKQTKALSKRFYITCVALIIAAITIPSVVYYYQFKKICKTQDEMLLALKERVEVNVKTYMDSAVLAESTGANAESGVITKGNAQTKEGATASEVSGLITEEMLSKIEDNVLDELYAEIDKIIAEKYDKKLSGEELTNISNSVSALVTADIYEFKTDVRNQLSQLDTFYSTVNDMTGKMDEEIAGLTNDMAVLESNYEVRFAELEAADANLQSQITSIKTKQATLELEQKSLETEIASVKKDSKQIQSDLQTRIDSLRTSSESSDVELTNMLIKVQKELSNSIATEDQKVYDNAERIISLTDKMTSMNVSMTDAIEVLSKQTGSDTTELYNTLTALQNSLSSSDSDLSNAINVEMSERSKAVSEILSLIDSLSTSTSDTQDDIYLQIERKSRQLATDLADTSSDMKAEYTTLITNTNTDLTNYINETNKQLTENMNAQDEQLNTKINTTNKELNETIDNTKQTLTNSINTNTKNLSDSINATNNSLNNKIDSTNESLTTNINTTRTELTAYIDTENLQTREDMAAAILTLQEEISRLNDRIAELEESKLNISDSTRYTYSTTDGNTIRITVPDSNPNYSK